MKEYDIKITETLEKTVTVKALSKDQAQEQVQQAYYNSEHILDSENFTGVQFDTLDEREVQQNLESKLNVLLIKPGMYPQQVQIDADLESLQAAVGGYIQAVYPFEEPVAIITDEEGKLNGKEANRGLRTEDGELYDIICGDFLVIGLGEEDFDSLSPELTDKFEKQFHQPEMFVRMGKGIVALPLPDEMVKGTDVAPILKDSAIKSVHERDTR